jgi:signal transduction histidine kinase
LDSWERRVERLINLVPYVALVVSAALTWGASSFWPQASLPVTLALSAFAAAWMLWFVTLHPAWEERPVLMGVYFFVLIAVLAVLVIRAPLYGFFAFSGYLHAVYALRGLLRGLGVGLTSILCALSQVGGVGTLASLGGVIFFLVVMAFNIGVAGIMVFFSWVTVEQAARRQRMIAELAETNAKLADAMAENAGLHAQLLAQAREAGVLDERARMAREIHDTIAQGLTGIITQLEAARQVPEQTRRHLDAAAGLARQSLSEARRSVRDLQPEPLDGVPLPDALTDVAHRWSDLHALVATVTTTGTARPMHPEIEGTLLRTAQEALANVAKHAKATRVGLTLSYMEDQVTLDVRDDGVGFDPSAPPAADGPGGFGLRAMRQRLDRVAGQLEIESEPGRGTAICAAVPAIPTQVGPPAGSGEGGGS